MGNHVITQEMREYVTIMLEEHLRLRKSGHEPVVLPDEMMSLMYSAADLDPAATISRIVDETAYLFKEYHSRSTICEYLALRHYFSPDYNMMMRVGLLLGLHHPECNRAPMNVGNEASALRSISLLKAVIFLRKKEYNSLVDQVLTCKRGSVHNPEIGFRDNHCAELVIAHPEHYGLLFDTMMDRGYEEGIEVFKNMMETNAPALMHGAL